MEIGTKLKVSVVLSIVAIVLKIIVFVGPGWAVVRQNTYFLKIGDKLQENRPINLPQGAVIAKKPDISIEFGIWYYKVCTSGKDMDIDERKYRKDQKDMKGTENPMENTDHEIKGKGDNDKKKMRTEKQNAEEKGKKMEGVNWKMPNVDKAEKPDSTAEDGENNKCYYKCYNSDNLRENNNFPLNKGQGLWNDWNNPNEDPIDNGHADNLYDEGGDANTKEDRDDEDASHSNKDHASKTDNDHTGDGDSQSKEDHETEDNSKPRKRHENKHDPGDGGETDGNDERNNDGQEDDSHVKMSFEQKMRAAMKQKMLAVMTNFGQGHGSIRTYVEFARKVRKELAVHATLGLVLGIIGMIGAIKYARAGGVGKHFGRVACSTQLMSSFFLWMAVIRAAMCQLNHADAMDGMPGIHITAAVPWCLILGVIGAFISGLSAFFHLILITREQKSNDTEYSFQLKSGRIPMIVPKEYLRMTEAGPLPEKQTIA